MGLVDYRRVKKVSYDNQRFDSGAERSLYMYIQAREQSGEVELIQTQVPVRVCGPQGHECDGKQEIKLIPDFLILDKKLNVNVYEEMKGFETEKWRIKRRLWMHYGPGILRIYRPTARGPKLFEEISP